MEGPAPAEELNEPASGVLPDLRVKGDGSPVKLDELMCHLAGCLRNHVIGTVFRRVDVQAGFESSMVNLLVIGIIIIIDHVLIDCY